MIFNRLYFVLLLHLLVIDETVLVATGENWKSRSLYLPSGMVCKLDSGKKKDNANVSIDRSYLFSSSYIITGEETNHLRTRRSLSHPDPQKRYSQQQPRRLGTKLRRFMGNTQRLHFQEDATATIKAAFQHFMSDIITFHLRDRGKRDTKFEEQPQTAPSNIGYDKERPSSLEEEPFARRRLTMILTPSSPSGIVQQGVMIAASVQHLHVAYKTIGNTIRRRGRQAKRGFVTTLQNVGGFLRHAVGFTKRQCHKAVAFLFISLMNASYSYHSQLHTLTRKKDSFADPPASVTLSRVSSPLLSRISSPSATTCSSPLTITTSSGPTLLASSSTSVRSTVSREVTRIVTKEKAQTMLTQQVPTNSRMTLDKSVEVVVDVPGPSVLGGLFNKLLGGLIILSTGAIMGYFWSIEWRDVCLHAASQEFMDAADADAMGRIHANVAIPITPEASRY
jgi:hypothetical protein